MNALDIITAAMDELSLTESGQTIPAEDASKGLDRLNRILGKWSNMRLLFPTLTEISVTLTGAGSYTIGPTGDVVTSRPIRVNSASTIDANGVEYPVEVYSRELWDSIGVKAVTGAPVSVVYYEAINTNGRIYVYPRANGSTLNLDCQVLITSFPTLTTDLTLPDGYADALVLALADSMAASYGLPVPADIQRRHAAAVRAIKRTNAEPVLSRIDLVDGQDFMIERGY